MDNLKYGTYDLNPIVIGTDVVYAIIFPYAITSYTFETKVLTKFGRDKVAEFTITIDTVNKKVSFSLTDTQTALLTVGTYAYYFTQTDSDGLITKLFTGEVQVQKL